MKNLLSAILKATTTALKVTGKALLFGAKCAGNAIGRVMETFGNRDGVGTTGYSNRRSNKDIWNDMYGKKEVKREVKQEMSEAPTEQLEVIEPTREEKPSQASQMALMMDSMGSGNAEAIEVKAIEVEEPKRLKQNEVKSLTMSM